MNKYDDTDYQIEREESIEYEEKTADEIFEKLGYKKMAEHKFTEPVNGEVIELILYRDDVQRLDIEFWNDKSISKMCNYDVSYITMQELKAINKKCQELGWIDE